MKPLDIRLQDWRIGKVTTCIRDGDRVLDIGCADGALFRALGSRLAYGVGIDPDASPAESERWRIMRGSFPEDLGDEDAFDAIVALAVLEHIPRDVQPSFAKACANRLKPGGILALTVPSPHVDRILHVLIALRVLDGMEAHQHYGFLPRDTVPLFEGAGFRLVRHRRFQLGLNNVFVFRQEVKAND